MCSAPIMHCESFIYLFLIKLRFPSGSFYLYVFTYAYIYVFIFIYTPEWPPGNSRIIYISQRAHAPPMHLTDASATGRGGEM